ncbi:hypothetical protein BU23DRAFT_599603 [Bimuria novae-zelandiae CBS 107.79]|uniref:Uncharacterized protein n=1 Tax=Bimuria novae-zelandiae CBS 107.79 TaxID=1447943 RepID=A0A6A5V6Q7_9PLEO|nr:hypothetical protein BU23DRAFT_599603 [Bimuria novae-zelandiae CBS 107.79]
MAPLSNLISLLSLFDRAPKYPSYITITTEPQAPCRIHADNMPYSVHSFGSNVKLNVSCWTTSTMQDNKGRLNDNEGSFTYLWVNTNGSFGEPVFSSPGVGNSDQGGKALGEGCWLHEDAVKEGADIDFTEALEWCGPAPHHQIATPHIYNNTAFVCRNCTDLTKEACQKEYATQEYGYVDVGCWKKGTAVGGNTTWVSMITPPAVNCWISPDQFEATEWHGLPAGECKE